MIIYLTGVAPPNRPPSPIPSPVAPLPRGLVDPRTRSPVDPLIHSPDDPLTRGFMKSWTRGPVDLGAFLSAPGTPRYPPDLVPSTRQPVDPWLGLSWAPFCLPQAPRDSAGPEKTLRFCIGTSVLLQKRRVSNGSAGAGGAWGRQKRAQVNGSTSPRLHESTGQRVIGSMDQRVGG